MILQSLLDLYDRLKDDPDYQIAPPGYSLQKITFKVVLRPDGSLYDIQDMRQGGRPRQLRVFGNNKSSGSGLNPCFLWDNAGYLLGFKATDSNRERTRDSFEAFRRKHLDLEGDIGSPVYSAVCRFLEAWSPTRACEYPLLLETSTGFGVFQILAETAYVHQDPIINAWWTKEKSVRAARASEGQCLITGRWGALARLQPMIKGVAGGKSQAALVGFNDAAYESYGKEQAFNSPVLEEVAFQYGTALNALLDGPMRKKHRMRLVDSTIVFWTERPSLAEDVFGQYAQYGDASNNTQDVQDEALRQKLLIFIRALRIGIEKYSEVDKQAEKARFFLLSLSPNAARLSVRLFCQGTIRELLDCLRRHHEDIRMERQFDERAKRPDPEFPPLWMLLNQTARKSDDIPPILSGPLLRAVLTGARYPDGLYAAVIRRIHSDREINYIRASIIKGWLVRNRNMEVSMSLDEEKKDPAYRVGRLFAALEKTQYDALGNLNSSIRDRFYSAASASPRSVFSLLLRTYQHHLGKLEGGRKINREKLIQEIVEPLDEFPAHFDLAEQGMFALGYYHQMRAFFRRKTEKDDES